MRFNKVELYESIIRGDNKRTESILSNNLKLDTKTGKWSLYLALKSNNLFANDLLVQYGAKLSSAGVAKATSKKNSQ